MIMAFPDLMVSKDLKQFLESLETLDIRDLRDHLDLPYV